jgi:hypothetical protein
MIKLCDMIFLAVVIIFVLSVLSCINCSHIKNKNDRNIVETFDNKINRMTLLNCGNACTVIDGCNAFSYDDITSTCWISKKPILGQTTDGAYFSDYKPEYKRCNKVKSVSDTLIASADDMLQNATYTCYPNEHTQKQSSDGTTEVYYPSNYQYDIYSVEYPKSNNILSPISGNITTPLNNTVPAIPLEYEDVKDIISTPTTDAIYAMIEKDDEYLGQYQFQHRCSSNISKNDCLKACVNDLDCVGTEWNPLYLRRMNDSKYMLYRNVCCPKRQLKSQINRRDMFRNGKFYVKTVLDNTSLTSTLKKINKNENVIII